MPVIAVITGANRGIGLGVAAALAARGDIVVLGSRSLDSGRRAAEQISAAGQGRDGRVLARRIDVTDEASVAELGGELQDTFGRVDALVNNAAIHYDTWQRAATADLSVVREALATNVLGAWQTTLTLFPLLRQSAAGRIVNVSSEAGSLTNMGGGTPAHHVSKAAGILWAVDLPEQGPTGGFFRDGRPLPW